MENKKYFFLGANTKDGFVSLFEQSARERGGRAVYALKSGPGCGKSTLLGALAEKLGGADEYIRCASDPDSLDGVLFPRFAVLDGTAPHVLEPELPGADGGYIVLPPFVRERELSQKLPELREAAGRARGHFAQSARLISAAARLDEGIRARLAPHLPEERLRARARGILARELGKKTGAGEMRARFIDGVTPRGYMRLYGTARAMADKIYAVSDTYGLAGQFLEELRDGALENGRVVYTCLCPVNPERVLHVILPEARLAFVTSDARTQYEGEAFRNIRIDAYLPAEQLRAARGRLRLTQKISRSLLDDASDELMAAREQHDIIEALYRPHIDVAALDALRDSLAKSLLQAL